jgi:hypothetical protein
VGCDVRPGGGVKWRSSSRVKCMQLQVWALFGGISLLASGKRLCGGMGPHVWTSSGCVLFRLVLACAAPRGQG